MIWSLIKITIFVAMAIAISFGLSFVLETPGGVDIAFGGREFNLTPIGFIIAIGVLLVGFWLLLKLAGLLVATIRFIIGDETALKRYWGRNRERRGFDALAEGMIALASGEGSKAMAKATKAERLLSRPELTRLLNAQAAEMAGNTQRALEHYKELLQDDRTRFVGVRGILKQKLADGDTETALKLAEKAFALRPNHHGNLDTLFLLQTDTADWEGARNTITAKQRAKALPKDVARRRDAVLSLADAVKALAHDEDEKAKFAALHANKLAPTLIPAAVLSARMLARDGDTRQATKILKTAWAATPHPDLANAFGAIEADETTQQRHKRFQQLVKLHPDHPETKMLLAELALAQEDFPAARRELGNLAEEHPTTRTLALMAAIERGSGADDSTVRAFLAKALNASRGEQWVCSGCGHVHSEWSPTCDSCNAFDTFEWKLPSKAENETPMDAVLPLIIGAAAVIEEEVTQTSETKEVVPDEEPVEEPVITPEPIVEKKPEPAVEKKPEQEVKSTTAPKPPKTYVQPDVEKGLNAGPVVIDAEFIELDSK